MTAFELQRDTTALTLTIVSAFDTTVERLWQIWADPRQLEQWWGPPGYPATIEEHDLTPGGKVSYFMTGPEGEKYPGWWIVGAVEPPTTLVFTDGFADDEGEPDDDLPTTISEIRLQQVDEGLARMTITSRFGSAEAMEQILEMGAEEGLTLALGQVGPLLSQ